MPADAGLSNKILKPLASLRLTVTLLAMSMVLIFAGTSAQVEKGIWDVQRIYFHSWFCFIEWRLFFPLWPWGLKNIPGAIPFPGGYTLIVLLLINLLAAHAVRFKLSWKRSGILLIHGGLLLMLVGEIITSQFAIESQMVLDVGGSANYTSDTRFVELAVTDPSPADHDEEIVIPASRLMEGGTIQHPRLPFAVRVDQFHLNSTILGPVQAGAKKDVRATAGTGADLGLTVVPLDKFSGTEAQKIDAPSSYVTLLAADRSLGTYLVSLFLDQPQIVDLDGKQYWIQLRAKRYYQPYTVRLVKFSHDRYTGTDVPKNFSSLVQLTDPTRNVNREVLIWMNHPLRHAGETFYQASFKPGDQTSILQVVKNPGWLIPYISCVLVGLGFVVHFGMHLLGFLRRTKVTRASGPAPSLIPAGIITAICAVYLLSLVRGPESRGDYDLKTFASLPVSFDGRTMPLDSLANNSLRILSGKSSVDDDAAKTHTALEWLADVLSNHPRAAGYKSFYIVDPDVKALLGLDEAKKRFSVNDLAPNLKKLEEQFKLAHGLEPSQRDPYQRNIETLGEHILLFNRLSDISTLLLSPPIASQDWRTVADAMDSARKSGQPDPGAESMIGLVQAYGDNRPDQFNALAGEYYNLLQQRMPGLVRKLDVEVIFNRASPFTQCMALYVLVFLLAAVSWLKWQGPLARAALGVLVLALVFHTLGLVTRIYLQGRPPVTNLYSAAIFVAWAVVVFCVAMELIYRNGVASAAASAIAFPSLLIAHYLAGSGDTMQMLQAVLDTNIWLATHVVVVALGYSATLLAGFIGIAYVGGHLIGKLDDAASKTISRMIYGVLCFAMLFSFVGTVLGGIWADQSWGRFWGWDPKENGAVLIVVWNAIILHARWGGLVRERGVALLAIFGNVVTAWSFFGTNMLGVGLHSYGFTDTGVPLLGAWVGLMLALIVAGVWLINPYNQERGGGHLATG